MCASVLLCVHALMDRQDYRVSPHILHTPPHSNHSLPFWREHCSDHPPFPKPHNNTPAEAWPLISLIFSERTVWWRKIHFWKEWRDRAGLMAEMFFFLSLSLSQCFEACEAFTGKRHLQSEWFRGTVIRMMFTWTYICIRSGTFWLLEIK